MAKTFYSTSDAETKKLWDEKLFRDTTKELYFKKFMGSDSKSIIQVNEALTKEKGDNVTITLRKRLTGDPIINGVLEGNEQALETATDSVTIKQYRLGVRDKGKITRQRAFFAITDESRSALVDQGAETVDQLIFDALQLSPTKIFYGGDATSLSDIEANDLITPALLSKLRAAASAGFPTETTSGERAQTPIRPVMIDGKAYWVFVTHPYTMFDLKVNPTFAQARREAEVRGKENPIFSGATAIWDGIIIHEHENIPLVYNQGATTDVTVSKGLFMGQQSGYWAWGQRPEVVIEKFDYGNEIGYGWDILGAAKKPVFDSLDYGMVSVQVATTNAAG